MAKNEKLDEIGMVQSGERRQRSCQPKGLMCVQNPRKTDLKLKIENHNHKFICDTRIGVIALFSSHLPSHGN